MDKLPDLFTTLDEPAPYVATALIDPPAPHWLHLPSVHARLLPLALAAGHERLHLVCDLSGAGNIDCLYEARGAGGLRGNVTYIGWLEPGEGDTAARFEAVLREKLLAAALPPSLRGHQWNCHSESCPGCAKEEKEVARG